MLAEWRRRQADQLAAAGVDNAEALVFKASMDGHSTHTPRHRPSDAPSDVSAGRSTGSTTSATPTR